MIKDPNCKNKNWKMAELDQLVIDEIKKLALDPNYISEAQKEKTKTVDMQKIAVLEKEIEKVDTQISRFMDLYGIGKFSIEQVSQKVDPLNEQRQKLEKELEALTASEAELTEEEVMQIVENFDEVLDGGDYDAIRLIIDTLIESIVIDNEDVYINWKFV